MGLCWLVCAKSLCYRPRPFSVDLTQEIQRRRTFAIISHPDAGKTTLTEKLLLYGGAVQLAGSVTARKNQRATTSDWMELERKRGISISSTVLQFDYAGFRINLLDTPGHKDFSEDTYRVLTAVDAVVMVIDSAKGIESQTRKLFEVCRQRGVPIFTYLYHEFAPGFGGEPSVGPGHANAMDHAMNIVCGKPPGMAMWGGLFAPDEIHPNHQRMLKAHINLLRGPAREKSCAGRPSTAAAPPVTRRSLSRSTPDKPGSPLRLEAPGSRGSLPVTS